MTEKGNRVFISDNFSYIIYSDDYLLDKEGNRKDSHGKDSLKCYEYGILCIETESVTYRFRKDICGLSMDRMVDRYDY